MVKRKAEKSLEEWLGESGLVSTRNQVEPATAEEEQVTPPTPTAEATQPAEIVEPVAVDRADVVAMEEDAVEWFRDLLSKFGYER